MRCTRVHDNYGVNVYKIKRWYILNEHGAMATFGAKILQGSAERDIVAT